MTIFEELFTAASAKGFEAIKPSDKNEAYLEELVRVIIAVEPEIWDALSEPSQKWVNDGVKSINAEQPVTYPEGFTGNAAVTPKAPVTAVGKGGVASVYAAPKKKSEGMGVVEKARRTVIENETWSASQVYAFMAANGYAECKRDTVNVVVSDLKKIISLAKEMGVWTSYVQPAAEVVKQVDVVAAEEPVVSTPESAA